MNVRVRTSHRVLLDLRRHDSHTFVYRDVVVGGRGTLDKIKVGLFGKDGTKAVVFYDGGEKVHAEITIRYGAGALMSLVLRLNNETVYSQGRGG